MNQFKNKDKKLIEKLKTNRPRVSINAISINSVDQFIDTNFSDEFICIDSEIYNNKLYGVKLFRLKDNKKYYIPLDIINQIKFNESVKFIGFDFNSLLTKLKYNPITNFYWDCWIATKLLDENIMSDDLVVVFNKYVNKDIENNIDKLYELYKFQYTIFQRPNLNRLYRLFEKIEMPCIKILYDISCNGFLVDNNTINEKYRKYISSDSKIHCKLNQYGSITGRIYSSNPSIQNIKKEDRAMFIPNSGNCFISSDFAQEEIRILASLSNDNNLINIFNDDRDPYAYIASLIFNKPYEQCMKPSSFREKAKVSLLSIIYGTGDIGLSKQLNCTMGAAKDIKNKILNLFPKVKEYIINTYNLVEKQKYVETLFGRKRRFHKVESNREYRQAINAIIQGTGADILKIILIKLYKSEVLNKLNVKILLPIHDEIIFECPIVNKEEAKREIKNIMENTLNKYLQVTLKCDIVEL